jgi:hypothetical protein
VTISLCTDPSVVDVLRGDRTQRPPRNTTSAAGLRAQLEDGIFAITGNETPVAPIVVRPSSLRQPIATADLALSSLGLLRGALVTQLLRLRCVGVSIENAFDDAVETWRAEGADNQLFVKFNQLDADDRARLATDVIAHDVTLSRALGELSSHWTARTSVRATHRLAGGRVVLTDVVDLTMGAHNAGTAAVVLLDVTTSPLGEGAERTMRFHALVETLRTSIVPLRSATFSTATGELWTRDVDATLLTRSADEVLGAIRELWSRR